MVPMTAMTEKKENPAGTLRRSYRSKGVPPEIGVGHVQPMNSEDDGEGDDTAEGDDGDEEIKESEGGAGAMPLNILPCPTKRAAKKVGLLKPDAKPASKRRSERRRLNAIIKAEMAQREADGLPPQSIQVEQGSVCKADPAYNLWRTELRGRCLRHLDYSVVSLGVQVGSYNSVRHAMDNSWEYKGGRVGDSEFRAAVVRIQKTQRSTLNAKFRKAGCNKQMAPPAGVPVVRWKRLIEYWTGPDYESVRNQMVDCRASVGGALHKVGTQNNIGTPSSSGQIDQLGANLTISTPSSTTPSATVNGTSSARPPPLSKKVNLDTFSKEDLVSLVGKLAETYGGWAIVAEVSNPLIPKESTSSALQNSIVGSCGCMNDGTASGGAEVLQNHLRIGEGFSLEKSWQPGAGDDSQIHFSIVDTQAERSRQATAGDESRVVEEKIRQPPVAEIFGSQASRRCDEEETSAAAVENGRPMVGIVPHSAGKCLISGKKYGTESILSCNSEPPSMIINGRDSLSPCVSTIENAELPKGGGSMCSFKGSSVLGSVQSSADEVVGSSTNVAVIQPGNKTLQPHVTLSSAGIAAVVPAIELGHRTTEGIAGVNQLRCLARDPIRVAASRSKIGITELASSEAVGAGGEVVATGKRTRSASKPTGVGLTNDGPEEVQKIAWPGLALPQSKQTGGCSTDKSRSGSIVYPSRELVDAVEISLSDLQLLKPGAWLNDTIVDFYIQYILREGHISEKVKSRFHFYSSLLFGVVFPAVGEKNKIGSRALSRAVRWARGTDIFSKAYIVVPICHEDHWSVAIISHPGGSLNDGSGKRTFIHLDSMGSGGHDTFTIYTVITTFLEYAWESQGRECAGFASTDFEVQSVEVPLQENGSDCGVFVLLYIEKFIQQAAFPFKFPQNSLFGALWFPTDEASTLRTIMYEMLGEWLKVPPDK